MIPRLRPFLFLALAAAPLVSTSAAQQRPGRTGDEALAALGQASQLIIPQSRSFAIDRNRTPQPIVIEGVQARVDIVGQTARTAIEILLRNPSSRQEEAVLLMPVPQHAAVSSFIFEGVNPEPTAQIMPLDSARRLYDSIVQKLRDPALLEFSGHNLLRSSVFPVAPGGTQRVHVTYEHLLGAEGNRIDYALLRSESLEQTAPWKIAVRIQSKRPISTVYSPTHEILQKRKTKNHFTVSVVDKATRKPGPFLLSYLTERSDRVTASLFAYPAPEIGGGYFLLLAGLPATSADARKGLKREVTLVLDRSGSMAGEKMDQARAAALQVVEGLADGEGFNIIDYSTNVASFATKPVVKGEKTTKEARAYLASLRPGGGTNIHDALVEALRPEPIEGTLPIVLFLTDGLPTIGQTSEVWIRNTVEQGNPHQRRVFTFGVGHDVNVPLLDRVAEVTRATATYVLPEEDVEVKVAGVFEKLYGPVLSGAKLATLGDEGEMDTRRVREQQPQQLPDLFENDQLVVLGQYRGEDPLKFVLAGDYLGKGRKFEFDFDLKSASTRNAFVPRLWASRQIAFLIDQVRQAGARAAAMPRVRGSDAFADTRLKELRDEIMELSTKFGILSEYTAFLATEGTRLGEWSEMVVACGDELDKKAMSTRWGQAAVNQGENLKYGKAQQSLNPRNGYLDDKLKRVEVSTVQQINDRAFFKRGKRWIDGRVIRGGKLEPEETVKFGSERHIELLRELVKKGRNGVLSLDGEILLRLNDKNVLIVNDDGC